MNSVVITTFARRDIAIGLTALVDKEKINRYIAAAVQNQFIKKSEVMIRPIFSPTYFCSLGPFLMQF